MVLWGIYLVSTFLLQITFLNMLIAIMNDTYTNVMEVEAQSSRIEKINILSDFRLLLKELDLDMNFQYIFTVKKKVQINDDDNLEN